MWVVGQPFVWDRRDGEDLRCVVTATNRQGDITHYRAVDIDPEEASYAFTDDEARAFEVGCAWFALCDHTAIGFEPHPILGDVPICERCRDKNARLRG